jgi:hypothetical protein
MLSNLAIVNRRIAGGDPLMGGPQKTCNASTSRFSFLFSLVFEITLQLS